MDCFRAGALRDLDQAVAAQVALSGRRATKSVRLVRGAHVRRATIGIAEDGDASDAKLAAAAGPSPDATALELAAQAPTAALARDLEAGRLTPAAAVDQILEQVLAQQVGPDAPAAVREQVRAALKDALENDPLLAEQLRRLGA